MRLDRLDLNTHALVWLQGQRLIGDEDFAVEMGVERNHGAMMIAQLTTIS